VPGRRLKRGGMELRRRMGLGSLLLFGCAALCTVQVGTANFLSPLVRLQFDTWHARGPGQDADL
jgi:hypothetical protein